MGNLSQVWILTVCLLALSTKFITFLNSLEPPQGFFQQFWEKAPGQNWEKMIDLTANLGEINDIEHNKGSKIYPQNRYFRLNNANHTT